VARGGGFPLVIAAPRYSPRPPRQRAQGKNSLGGSGAVGEPSNAWCRRHRTLWQHFGKPPPSAPETVGEIRCGGAIGRRRHVRFPESGHVQCTG